MTITARSLGLTLAAAALTATAMITGTGVAAAAVPSSPALHVDLTSGTAVLHENLARRSGEEVVITPSPVPGHLRAEVLPTQTRDLEVVNESQQPVHVTLWTDPGAPLTDATLETGTRLVVHPPQS